MMRNKVISSMQKTYDECYLTCSTAVFFEGQNNENEALRSWKTALEQINYHNAYRVSASYVPRTETEKALFDSLKQMELQCKERVDLLEALKQSRKEAAKDDLDAKKLKKPSIGNHAQSSNWLGDQTIAPIQYSDLPTPGPPLPARPVTTSRVSSSSVNDRPHQQYKPPSSPLASPPKLPLPQPQQKSRSPSPESGRRTMRKTLRPDSKTGLRTPRTAPNQTKRRAPMQAAGLAWDTHPRAGSVPSIQSESDPSIEARLSSVAARRSLDHPAPDNSRWTYPRNDEFVKMPDPADYGSNQWPNASSSSIEDPMESMRLDAAFPKAKPPRAKSAEPELAAPVPPPHVTPLNPVAAKRHEPLASQLPKPPSLTYRQEYPPAQSKVPPSLANNILHNAYNKQQQQQQQQQQQSDSTAGGIARKPVAPAVPPPRRRVAKPHGSANAESDEELAATSLGPAPRSKTQRNASSSTITPPSTDVDSPDDLDPAAQWDKRAEQLLKNLPKGVDETAAKNILNEIVVKGDEVHWEDVAGLEGAKKALKEAVVYPFLRPDLFMGLREPARGMLLFGPPGTGKTMLARAVATESKSTFFAISASSLTSKWHGESEKLVRALFALAKVLTPSIIFVDEIDSLLSSRGGGSEHEASRRSKTEFLIQWSDLQRAAVGKDVAAGDASRVLVLAATNCPWDIDEAARRRFVRRQYIPLPEPETRETQLRTLIGAQNHDLSERDIRRLVRLTEGYSGSDITALAKDAAMGPLRNLGEALLYTPMDQIRPIGMPDFEASLVSIRPSVGKKGLEEFEEWAREYGERGG